MGRPDHLWKKLFSATLLLTPLLTISPYCLAAEIDDIRAAVKAEEAKWTPAETSIYKLPPAERKKRNGVVQPQYFAALAPGQLVSGQPLYVMSAPSGTFDWRNFGGTNYVTAVRDQGACGDCWAFAATAGLESYVLLHGNYSSSLNLSEQVLLSCGNAGTCNGGSPAGAAIYISKTGLPPESYYPYTASNGSCTNAGSGWQSAADTVISWQYVTAATPDLTTLKDAVYTYGPVVTTMAIYADFYAYKSGVYHHVTGGYDGAHAVLIVGYSDNTAYPGGGYFIAKNSWGTGWGEAGGTDTGGYFRIAYSELKSVTKFGWYSIAYDVNPTCTYSLDSYGTSEASSGGASTVGITTAGTCPWSAASSATWLTLGSTTSGTGSGTLSYTVAANATTVARTGTITIKDAITRTAATYTVTQQPCTYTLSATSSSLTDTGGTGTLGLTVSTASGTWSAASSATWLVITSAKTGTGSANIAYTVAPNTGSAARTGAITVKNSAGKVAGTLTVSEAGSSFQITASSGAFTDGGGTGSINVTVDRSDAPWTAVSSATWMTITAGAKGTGTGAVSFSLPPNTGSVARTGTITVKDVNAKVLYTLNVSEAPSVFSFTASSGSFTNAGGTGGINVTVDRSDAPWTAVSSATWMTITAGAKGTGTGAVSFSVSPNTSSVARTGTITVKDSNAKVLTTLTVTEASSSFGVTSTNGAFTKTGGTGSIGVTVNRTDAPWTAVSSASWLVITAGSKGTGNGTVTFSAAANTTTAIKTGTITIKDSVGTILLKKTITVSTT